MKKRTILLALLFAATGLSPLQAQKKYKAYIVSNSHLDTQWNWDVQTTIDEYLKHTLVRNFYLFQHYPNYVFNFEGGVKYNWMKEYYPLEYELVKKYIKEGRWHISGSSWDANDTNVPSSSAIFCWDNNSINKSLELNLQISSCRTVLDSVIHCPLLQHIVA